MTASLSAVPVSATSDRSVLAASSRLVAPFWRSRASLRSWTMVGVIALTIYGAARLAIWGNEISGPMTNAVVARDAATLRPFVLITIVIMVLAALLEGVKLYVRQWIEIDWRQHLTDRLMASWLGNRAYYRIERDQTLDNADQRIADDVFLFIDRTIALVLAMVSMPTTLVVYGMLLWTLGGPIDVQMMGHRVFVPGGFFWAISGGVAIAIALVLLAGYPLLRLNVVRQRYEADYRFSLLTLRLNAEQVALYHGQGSERTRLDRRFQSIVSNWHQIMGATIAVAIASTLYMRGAGTLAMVAGYPRYAAGEIDFGRLAQIGGAASALIMSFYNLALFFQRGELYIWAAAVRRLDTLTCELERRPPAGITLETMDAGAGLATRGLQLARPDGAALAMIGDRQFAAGERWLVQGPSGVGKSTMIRALAGLWPYGTGSVVRDPAAHTLFLPQKSYVPEGSLRAALSYPAPDGRFDDAACTAALRRVRLLHLVGDLDTEDDWERRLSPGEQQRLAFARVVLHRPDVVLLDEATSALDHTTEAHVYTLIDDLLPDATIISIAHRDSVRRFHSHHIML